MTDLDQILPLWQELRESKTEYVLATVVMVEGSGYRKPGARMLIASDGRRAGTISGGCLEAEVARKAFWRTEDGPVVQQFSTKPDDGDVPYGMGCGGVIHLLLERSQTADAVMRRLAAAFAKRMPLAIATVIQGAQIGLRAFWPSDNADGENEAEMKGLMGLARCGSEEECSFSQAVHEIDGSAATVRVEWIAARPGLFVFGAGDDAVPLVRLARQLGWYVAVADGRSHLATRARFPEANELHVLSTPELSAIELRPTDAAAVMTHSLEQDTRALSGLLRSEIFYLGVLGPRPRTEGMLLSIAREWDARGSRVERQAEEWMEWMHSPMGLDLGGSTPADIALAVIAEIQQCRHQASGLALRVVRGQAASLAR